jgi:hypothetical protein
MVTGTTYPGYCSFDDLQCEDVYCEDSLYELDKACEDIDPITLADTPNVLAHV